MSKRLLTIFKGFLLTVAVVVLSVTINSIKVSAEEEGDTYEGTVNAQNALNVREGAGTGFGQIKDESGSIIQLKPQEKVVILDEAVADDGKIWYKIQFEREGKTYKGYAYSTYIDKGEKIVTPEPTPTPTATPEPTPTQIESAIATKGPTPTLEAAKPDETTPSDGEKSGSKKAIIFVIFAVIAVAVLFFGLFIVLGLVKQNKRKNRIRNARKVDRMKNSEQESGGKRRPEIKRADDEGYVREVRQSVYYTNPEEDDMYGISSEPDDKRTLRAAVDRLQEHDIINHKIYGEGEVYDNSDVKLMEVRFGNDVRFLNKDSIVAKRLIEIVDDEDQANARRKNRRNRNKRNDY